MITVTAEKIKEFENLLKDEEFPREALADAEVLKNGTVVLVLRPTSTSRTFVATLRLTTLVEI